MGELQNTCPSQGPVQGSAALDAFPAPSAPLLALQTDVRHSLVYFSLLATMAPPLRLIYTAHPRCACSGILARYPDPLSSELPYSMFSWLSKKG